MGVNKKEYTEFQEWIINKYGRDDEYFIYETLTCDKRVKDIE